MSERFPGARVILFGSRARGDHFKDSDYDLLVISPAFEGVRFGERMARVFDLWDQYPAEIEPLCYTPAEFEMKRHELGIVRQAVAEGIEIT